MRQSATYPQAHAPSLRHDQTPAKDSAADIFGRDTGVVCWLGFFCASFSPFFGGELDCNKNGIKMKLKTSTT